VSKSDVANQITSKMTDAAGNKPDSVTCPDNLKGVKGATLRCQLTDSGQKYGISVPSPASMRAMSTSITRSTTTLNRAE
jgi:hypothetical protein